MAEWNTTECGIAKKKAEEAKKAAEAAAAAERKRAAEAAAAAKAKKNKKALSGSEVPEKVEGKKSGDTLNCKGMRYIRSCNWSSYRSQNEVCQCWFPNG